jgi:2-oxoglutarate dehydrogenase E2 component (dihydrolipoamide succinyltransferase)
MSTEIKVPNLPESVSDATLVAWHKKAGDSVSRDENLADLETDKVVLEVPAPSDGIVQEIRIEEGKTVTAGDVLAILEKGGIASEEESREEAAAEPQNKAGTQAEDEETESGAEPSDKDEEESEGEEEAPRRAESAGKLSPAVRRLLDEHDLDATVVTGTGRDGRITKSDIMDYLKSHSDENVAPGDPEVVAERRQPEGGPSRSE